MRLLLLRSHDRVFLPSLSRRRVPAAHLTLANSMFYSFYRSIIESVSYVASVDFKISEKEGRCE